MDGTATCGHRGAARCMPPLSVPPLCATLQCDIVPRRHREWSHRERRHCERRHCERHHCERHHCGVSPVSLQLCHFTYVTARSAATGLTDLPRLCAWANHGIGGCSCATDPRKSVDKWITRRLSTVIHMLCKCLQSGCGGFEAAWRTHPQPGRIVAQHDAAQHDERATHQLAPHIILIMESGVLIIGRGGYAGCHNLHKTPVRASCGNGPPSATPKTAEFVP